MHQARMMWPFTSPLSSDVTPPLLPAEQRMIETFEYQRRFNLLRFLIPGFLGISLLSAPFAIYSDITGAQHDHLTNGQGSALSFHYYGSIQTLVGLIAFLLALWGLRQQRINLAAYAFFLGIAINVSAIILIDSFLPGPLGLRSIPEFALTLLPIALAGILGGGLLILGTTLGAVMLTFADFTIASHDQFLQTTLQQSDGFAVILIPIVLEVAMGIIILAASNGLRQAQRELNAVRIAYEREKELDRLKDRFISNVNHELRTPIMSLQGYLAIARELLHRGEMTRLGLMLQRGSEVLKHLTALVESALRVRQLEVGNEPIELQPIALREVITGVLAVLEPPQSGEPERLLRIQLPPDLLVMADPQRLSQVFVNLLTNARKYSPAGSPIDISARVVSSASDGKPTASSPLVEVAIRDYGFGIPPESIPFLFQRFVRLERDIASPIVGSGLGLAICKAAMQSMGGSIAAASTGVAGEGTTFTFTLACAQASLVPA